MEQSIASLGTFSTFIGVPVLARADTMLAPGAVMSGWYIASPRMPRDEKSASIEVPPAHSEAELVGSGETVLHPAATLITHGATLYGFSVFSPGPSFPAANTTAMPAL